MRTICAILAVAAAAAFSAAATSSDLSGPVVVTTRGPLSTHVRERLDELGLTLHGAAGPDRFIGSVRPGASLDLIRRLSSIDGIEPLSPADRLDSSLAKGAPAWMLAGVEQAAAAPIAAYVTLAGPRGADAVAGAGVQVVGEFRDGRGLVVSGTLAQVQGLTQLDSVLYVEAALPALEATNDDNRARTGAAAAEQVPYLLDGAGVTALVFDVGGVRTTHMDLAGRVTLVDNAPPSPVHPTHVAGTLAGSGAASGGQYRGMAPGANILSARFQAGLLGTFFYTNPGDVEADYAASLALAPDLAVANNSIGLNVSSNNFPCDLFGNYGATSALVDGFVHGSLGKPITIAWAAGNDRPGDCGSEYGTISPPSAAKNTLVVGALNSDDDSMTSFSSWGPTDDGRLKPDICAPGDQVSGDGGVTSTSSASDTAYATLQGTSMASPTAAGLAVLLIQDYRAHNPGAGDPLPSTIKAALMHTAADVQQPGPDYRTGYGSVRVIPAIDAMRAGRFLEDELTSGERAGFEVNVAPGDPELRLTLAWDDPASLPNSAVQLINDLDLIVLDPNGGRAFPWTLDPADPGADAVRTGEDHRNNAEQVLVEDPAPGIWRIQIAGDIPQGPQTLSLLSSHVLAPRGVRIRAIDVIPGIVAPGEPSPVEVEIVAFGETIAHAEMFYRFAPGDPFQSAPLSPAEGDHWRAMLPPAGCGDTPEVYFVATGSVSGEVANPMTAPAESYGMLVGEIGEPFADTFETDLGWTVATQASAGGWERGVPIGNGQRGDPTQDFDGDGSCYVTGNGVNIDLDGVSTLTSPVFDAAPAGVGGEATLTYARWFHGSGSDPSDDTLTVEISADGGASWTLLETVHTDPNGINPGWVEQSWPIGDVLTPTSTMQVRFTAADVNVASLVEAAVDAVRVTTFACDEAGRLCETDGQPGIDVFDLLAYLDGWFVGAASADVDGVPGVDVFDLLAFLDCWFEGG
jgi:subtilisin family serine protease